MYLSSNHLRFIKLIEQVQWFQTKYLREILNFKFTHKFNNFKDLIILDWEVK